MDIMKKEDNISISAVIITKNEENKIRKCLDSLNNLVNEIIIIDDLSSDNTLKICKEYGAKVIVNESKGNFDRQRNLGIENATGDWILQMDADEIVTEEAKEKIKEAIKDPKDFVAFKLKRLNFFFDHPLRYGGVYDYQIKLFKKGYAYYIGESIHETLKVDGKIGSIDADVLHYPCFSLNTFINKLNFYTDIETEQFLKDKQKISFKEIKYRLTWKALKLFWKLYIKKKGYKDGMYGLIWAIINVIGPEIRWLKIWEKALKEGKLES